MKILIVTPYIPHPLAGHGGSEYEYGLVKYLCRENDVTVLSFLDEHEETLINDLNKFPVTMRYVRRMKGKQASALKNIKLLLLRLYQLLRSIVLWEPYYVSKYSDRRMARLIREETSSKQYDAVQVEFSQMAQYIQYIKSGVTVLREHDVAIRPWERLYKSTGFSIKKLMYYIEYRRWLKYEPRVLKQFDHVLTFIEEDSQYMRDISWVDNIHCHARGIEIPDTYNEYSNREPFSLLFVGVYNHTPNRDAVIWLCDEIFPLIQKQCPQAVLYVVGKHPPEEIQALAVNNAGIKILGFVPKLEEYLNKASVFISPGRLGGGIKTKVIHAQSYGLPVVSTRIGCEGIKTVNESTVIVTDTVEGLANSVVTLFNDRERAGKMAQLGRELVVKHYAWTSVIKDLEEYYRKKK